MERRRVAKKSKIRVYYDAKCLVKIRADVATRRQLLLLLAMG